jgi:hypothetical protein
VPAVSGRTTRPRRHAPAHIHDDPKGGAVLSYLTKYALRRPKLGRRVRVDERLALNLPGYHGGAYVRVFVEDTSGRTRWRGTPPEPRVRLRIADCDNEIRLWFEVDSPGSRTNSLHKIDTLVGSLRRFRAALAAEADLYATRSSRKEDLSCRT